MHRAAFTSMRCELEKLSSRKADLFEELSKKAPQTTEILRGMAQFKGQSPFYIKGKNLKNILAEQEETKHPSKKGLRSSDVDTAKHYIVVPDAEKTLRIKGKGGVTINAPAHVYLAHELGHSLEHDSGLMGRILHSGAPRYLSAFAPIVSGIGGTIAGMVPRSGGTGVVVGTLLGTGVGGLMQLPLVYREGQATKRGLELLREAGATKAEMTRAEAALKKAKSTYNRVALEETLLSGAMAGLGSLRARLD